MDAAWKEFYCTAFVVTHASRQYFQNELNDNGPDELKYVGDILHITEYFQQQYTFFVLIVWLTYAVQRANANITQCPVVSENTDMRKAFNWGSILEKDQKQ